MTYEAIQTTDNSNLVLDNVSQSRDAIGLGIIKRLLIESNAGLTSLNVFGIAAPTVAGSTSILLDTTGNYLNYAGAATNGTVTGLTYSSFTAVTLNTSPVMTTSMKTGSASTDIQNCRIWNGLFSASPTGVDTLTTQRAMAFRYAPTVDGTVFWRTVTSDGASSTTTTTSIAIASNTRYELRIVSTSAQVDFFINDVWAATHTTNLPSPIALAPFLTITNTSAGAKNIRLSNIVVHYN